MMHPLVYVGAGYVAGIATLPALALYTMWQYNRPFTPRRFPRKGVSR